MIIERKKYVEYNIKAYAKLNLFLDITAKREDGYHDINTIMQMIDLADDINIKIYENTENTISIKCDNPEIPVDKKNIAYRACKLFFNEYGQTYKTEIYIEKHIPVEAGLGGSSADGAGVLVALNSLFKFPFTAEKMLKMGNTLGSDVPFCMVGGTGLCTGTGNIISELPLISDCAFLVIKPEHSFNTAKAYAYYDEHGLPKNRDFKKFTEIISDKKFISNTDMMYNVFEKIYKDERTQKIREDLMECGAYGTCMTGSGSAVFGVFENIEQAEIAFPKLKYSLKFITLPIGRT